MERICGTTMVAFIACLHGQLSGSRSWKPIQHSPWLDLVPAYEQNRPNITKNPISRKWFFRVWLNPPPSPQSDNKL